MNKKQFDECAAEYLAALPSGKKSEHTVKHYTTVLRNFGNFLGADDEEITPMLVVRWRVMLAGAGISNNTVRDYMVRLHTFFEWAVRMGVEQNNPVDEQEIPSQQEIRYDLLTADEIKRLLTCKQRGKGTHEKLYCRNRAIVVLLLQSGMRNSELRYLALEDLDWNGCTITVKHGKGDKSREVPFPVLAREAVKDYLNSGIRPADAKPSDLLFGTDKAEESGVVYKHIEGAWHEISPSGLIRIVREYTEKVCGHSVKTHALRHAYTSLCDDLGVSIGEVSKTLGHNSIRLTENTYRHILHRDKAAKNATAALDGI